MATISAATIQGTTGIHGTAGMSAESSRRATAQRHRRISPEAGRGLELLGHAIEYLADDYMYEGGQFSLADPRVQAMTLLMDLNRGIYYSCPELPTLGERFRAWMGIRAA